MAIYSACENCGKACTLLYMERHYGNDMYFCSDCNYAYHHLKNGGRGTMALKDWKNCSKCNSLLSYNIPMQRCEDCGFSEYRSKKNTTDNFTSYIPAVRTGYRIDISPDISTMSYTFNIGRLYDHAAFTKKISLEDLIDHYGLNKNPPGPIIESILGEMFNSIEAQSPFDFNLHARHMMAQDMEDEPLQRRGTTIYWNKDDTVGRYQPPRSKPKAPPMRLDTLKGKMLKMNQYSISQDGGGRAYLIEEDFVGPDYVKGLRVEDFEQFAIDLKKLIDDLKNPRDKFANYRQYMYSSSNLPQGENNVPKVIVTHDADTASYDIKFEIKGTSAWTAVEGVIAIIKATIPVSDRAYDPATKQWSILDKYWENLKELLVHSTFTIEENKKITVENFYYEPPAPAKPTKDSISSTLCKLLGVSSDILADNNALKKAYRKRALELHPDRNNGDGSKMSELNSIWSQFNAN